MHMIHVRGNMWRIESIWLCVMIIRSRTRVRSERTLACHEGRHERATAQSTGACTGYRGRELCGLNEECVKLDMQCVEGEEHFIRNRLLPGEHRLSNKRGGIGLRGKRGAVLVEYEADRRRGSLFR